MGLCISYPLLFGACGSAGLYSVGPAAYTTPLDNLSQAIAFNAGYSQAGIGLTDNPIRLQIVISDINLAQADGSTRNAPGIRHSGARRAVTDDLP